MTNITTPITSMTPPFSSELGGSSVEPKKPKNVSDSSWATYMKIYNYAKELGDPYPELFATQSALESGWFKSESGKNNFFGIKARKNEDGTMVNTREQTSTGKEYKIKDRFKNYNSIEEAIEDRYNRFSKIYSDAPTLNDAVQQLHDSSYATDTSYDKKLKQMLNMTNTNLNKEPYVKDKTIVNTNTSQTVTPRSRVEEIKKSISKEKDATSYNTNFNPEKELNFNINTIQNDIKSLKDTPVTDKKINADTISRIQNDIKALKNTNPKAMGGAINNFSQSNDLNEFNVGGLHETNPHGGIPMGQGSNGKMNTVEEGETSFDIDGEKFIFSNRITI